MSGDIHYRNLTRVLLPEGCVVPRSWLEQHKYGRHIIDNLLKSGQLGAVAHGVYGKPPIILTWESLVCSLQTRFGLDVVVGGLTALDLQGYGHYLSFAKPFRVQLYSNAPLPGWINEVVEGVDFDYHSDQALLGRNNRQWNTKDLLRFTTTYPWRDDRPSLIVSTPERAFLEILAEVPSNITVNHANLLMQSMTSLSPERLQELLENCHNIKVRRLFFWLAERHNWQWLKKIDRTKIDLGKGKRVIEKGGRLDQQYLITIPRDI